MKYNKNLFKKRANSLLEKVFVIKNEKTIEIL